MRTATGIRTAIPTITATHTREPAATVGEHRHHAPTHVAAYVVTCSDTRGAEQDGSGARIRQLLEDEGHTISGHEVIPDDAAAIEAALQRAQESGARAVLFTGGTGLSRRDVTVETLERRFEKPIPGFGELFRTLSFSEIGSAAMLSRATAGVIGGVVVFAMPGSPHAAGLAMRKLILPELGHLVRELSR